MTRKEVDVCTRTGVQLRIEEYVLKKAGNGVVCLTDAWQGCEIEGAAAGCMQDYAPSGCGYDCANCLLVTCTEYSCSVE